MNESINHAQVVSAADPLADLKAALANRTAVEAKVTRLVASADKKHTVGARCVVLGKEAFLPASQIVAPKQSLPGKTILVRVTEVTAAPGKTPVVVSQRAVFEDFVSGVALGSLLAGTAGGVSDQGSLFVRTETGFQALVPQRELVDGEPVPAMGEAVEAVVMTTDPARLSVIASIKWARALRLLDNVVEATVTGPATRKSDGRQVGFHCCIAGGLNAFLPSREIQGKQPAAGSTILVKVKKVVPCEHQLVVSTADAGKKAGQPSRKDARQGGERKQPEQAQHDPLTVGETVEGKLVSLDERGFQVEIAGGVEARLDLNEVSDEKLDDQALAALVGTTQKLVVIRLNDQRSQAACSLKRLVLAGVGLREPLTGTLVAVRARDNARIVALGEGPFKLHAVMRWLDCREAVKARAGDQVTVFLNSVIQAPEVVLTQKR